MKTNRITFRVNDKLKKELVEIAEYRGVSLSQCITDILELYSSMDVETSMKFHNVDLHQLNVWVKTTCEKREE